MARAWREYAGGKDPLEIRQAIREIRKNWWISIDYSHFDATIPSWLIKDCFSIIKEFFDAKYHSELDWICHNFIHSKIVTKTGIVTVNKGIPSGSNFTQVVGSMCNFLMMMSFVMKTMDLTQCSISYVKKAVGDGVSLNMQLMGDDNLIATSSGMLDIAKLSTYVGKNFGVVINPEKCSSGRPYTYPEFLRREWLEDGERAPIMRILLDLTHPEHDRLYDEYSEWHILYGIVLTYRKSFDATTLDFVYEQMKQYGGIQSLLRVHPRDLPGVYRAFGYKGSQIMLGQIEDLSLIHI